MPTTKITTFIYTNEPDAWDRFTIIQRWSDEVHPMYVDSNRTANSIFPILGGMFAPSHDNASDPRYPREVYCSWLEGNMFDADYRRAHPEINYTDAIVCM